MNYRLLSKDSPLQCKVIPVTHVKQNCSVIWCAETMRGAVVDPGGEIDRIRAFIDRQGVEVERLLITHGHPDHAGAATALAALLNVPIEGPHVAETEVIRAMGSIAATHGLSDCQPYSPDRWLADGDIVQVGRQQLSVLHCPGHTAGHAAYFCEAARLAFVGDILFRSAVGATSGPANHFTLLHSIRRKLFPLGDDVVFVPGHQSLSTFGDERLFNPVVSDFAAEDYEYVFDDPRFPGAAPCPVL
jgi:glyoxylase-like metal-dependent hydrolase (beta-lactamase superfamily II)